MRRVAISLLVIGLALVVVGCAPKASQEGIVPNEGDASQEVKHVEDWKDQYPDIYASYVGGVNEMKEYDGKSHSHAALKEKFAMIDEFPEGGMRCFACKTPDFTNLYNEYGDDIWTMKYSELEGQVVDIWGCYQCHENNPGGTLKATSLMYNTVAEDYVATLEPNVAVCGQCHNSLGRYMRSIVDSEGNTLETLDNPYRYGTDADSILKAFLEDGAPLQKTDDGVEYFKTPGCYDVELFQGSNHQQMGLGCTDCHMPEMTNTDGKSYVSHNASGSPLQNEAALETCLSCHSSKGIGSTDEMIEFVKGKQDSLATKFEEAQSSIDKLHGLIVAGTSNAQIDKQARDIYLKARWYQGYTDGDEGAPGIKAAHNYTLMIDYLQKSIDTAEQGVALYSA